MKHKLYYQFAGSCFWLVFVFLGYVEKFYPQWLQGFDNFFTTLIRSPYPAATFFYLGITRLGNPPVIILVTLFMVFLLMKGKRYIESLWLTINVVGIAGIANALLKLAFMRQRPTLEHLVTETSYSFPSGHATGSMILWGSLLFILIGLVKNQGFRLILQILCGGLILAVGMSRIYLGVHFPTDVLAGYCLALGWLLFTYPLFAEKRFVWRFKGKQR